MSAPPGVSIVIPVYNEEATLPRLFSRLYPALDALSRSYEIIFVDDGSRDHSTAVLREQFQKRPDVTRVVLLDGNYGQHPAIMAGFERCRGDVVVTLDADLQNPPEEIANVLAKFEEGYDYVGTIRRLRRDNAFRRIASRFLNALRERTTHIKMTDQGCMLRAYSRPIIEAINSCTEANTFIPALAYTFARRPVEIEVAHEERAAGESKYSVYKLIRLNFDLMTGFSLLPLQVFSVLGMLIAVMSMIAYIIVMIERLLISESLLGALQAFYDRDILQFFLLGIALFGIGLLGEYVGRIYEQVRGRPRYRVGAMLEKTEPDRDSATTASADSASSWAAVHRK
jgi:undecaprenyl-phosphate 4-deoxy-4-formamido-L-arabinose transferase